MIKQLGLAWIVVKDIKQAIKFYTETMGLKLESFDENFGWAELRGHEEGGARLGIAQTSQHESIQPGQNAIITFTVENFDEARADLLKKGVTFQGEIMDIPGVVRLQMVVDKDNNHFQIVQVFQ